MDFTPSPMHYIRKYAETGSPSFMLSVVGLNYRPDRSWFDARLTLDPHTGPVIGTAHVSIRVEDERCYDPISGRATTTSYTVCEIETWTPEPGRYLEIEPVTSFSSELGKALVCRLSPLIVNAVRAREGHTRATAKTFQPLSVLARWIDLAQPGRFEGVPSRKERFPRASAWQATSDHTGRYTWRADLNCH